MPIVKIKLKDVYKLDMINVNGGMNSKSVMNKFQPDYLINLALYDMASAQTITWLEDENKQVGYLFSENGIGIENNKELRWIDRNKAFASETLRDYVSGSPTLIINGEIDIRWGNKYSSYIDGKHKRSAIGFNDEELVLYTCTDSINLKTLAQRMLNYGCKYAINCDGGGSCCLQNKENVLQYSSRKNVSWFLVYLNESFKEEFEVYKYTNNSNKSKPVYETTQCKKKIGSLDPYEVCDCLYEMSNYKVVLYNITGTTVKKVGFIKE